MKNKIRFVQLMSRVFIICSALCLLSVSLLAFYDPQMVMDLVQVRLTNNDAYSSIRGVYGGVGLTVVGMLAYLLLRHLRLGLAFLSMLWGAYALSRLITIFVEGPLGTFGNKWIVIETLFFVISLSLFIAGRPRSFRSYSIKQNK